jgi:hypothetical protein
VAVPDEITMNEPPCTFTGSFALKIVRIPAQDPQQKQMITIKAAFPADMPREPLEKLATRGQLS